MSTRGHSKSGKPITDEMIEDLAAEADRGYEPGQLKGRRRGPGRPPLGASAKSVESSAWNPRFGPRQPSARQPKA